LDSWKVGQENKERQVYVACLLLEDITDGSSLYHKADAAPDSPHFYFADLCS